jgi:hypothetical protein
VPGDDPAGLLQSADERARSVLRGDEPEVHSGSPDRLADADRLARPRHAIGSQPNSSESEVVCASWAHGARPPPTPHWTRAAQSRPLSRPSASLRH